MPIHSPNIQAEYFKLLFDQHDDWECAGIFADEASSPNRAQFLQMIDKCRAGEIDAVITKSIARFGRNMLDTLLFTRELQHLGIDVLFQMENLHSCSLEGERMLMLMTDWEGISENISLIDT